MITINGNPITINGNFISGVDVMIPLPPIQPYTVRAVFTDGTRPGFNVGTKVQVSTRPNTWDLTYNKSNWDSVLYGNGGMLEILDGDLRGVTNLESTFERCISLTSVKSLNISDCTNMYKIFQDCICLVSVHIFDTGNVTSMYQYFFWCTALSSIPLFNTSKVTNMTRAFCGCKNVQSGALALYQQASTQATPPRYHYQTFYNCGSATQTGSAELAQIPSDWK